MLLEVKDVSIRFGGVEALKSVSFSTDPNCFVGLMGPNGAGKTTLINCISGIFMPQKGQIRFKGQDILALKSHEITNLGIARTFQDLNFMNLISNMSIMEYLKIGQFALHPRHLLSDGFQVNRSKIQERELKKRVYRLLEFFREVREYLDPSEEERGYPILLGRAGFPDLIDVEKRPLGILSFAWRRRLDLARALVSEPSLLLLDEPAQGLAPSEMDNLAKMLKLVRSEFKVAALIVEHNVPMLASLADKLVVMNYGEVITEGRPEEVTSDPEVIEIYLGNQRASEIESVQKATPKTDPSEHVPILDIRNIDVFYGQAQALSRVSLKLYRNQIACVIGTNGSGKSTLLRAISGIEKPNSGEILVNGDYLPLGWPERAVERGIQYVPQGHLIFPRLSVLENLKIGAYAYERRGIKTDLDRVFSYFPQLKDLGDAQGSELSGGLQQMLAIGQAIIGKPQCLLVDEPSLGLAPKLVQTLFDAIKRISVEEECSVLLVEQNVNLCLEMADYIYMMSAGILVGEGATQKIRGDTSIIKKSLGFS